MQQQQQQPASTQSKQVAIEWPQEFIPRSFISLCDTIQKDHLQNRSKLTNEVIYTAKHIALAHCTNASTNASVPTRERRHYFVVGNSTGNLSVFCESTSKSKESYFDENPIVSVKVHEGPIYAMEWLRVGDADHDDGILITGSEGEIAGWRCQDLMSMTSSSKEAEPKHDHHHHQQQQQEKHAVGEKKMETDSAPVAKLQPVFLFNDFPVDRSTQRKVETNALCFDRHRGLLYSGGGDDFVHIWDLKQQILVHKFHAGHKKGCYVLSLKCTRDMLFVGGDDGIIQVFDTSRGGYHHTHSLSPFTGDMSDRVSSSTKRRSDVKSKSNLSTLKHSSWASTIDISEDEKWMVCGGGAAFVTVWFIPSLHIVSVLPTSSTCNVALFHKDQIITAGNEKYIYFWERNGNLRMRLATGLKSIFAVDMVNAPHTRYDNICIVGGVGTDIRLLKNGQRVSTCSI